MLLARALYPDPKVLILDEGTANLDAENERKILDVLRSLSITRIAVAHRPATLEAAGQVYSVQSGTLSDLLSANNATLLAKLRAIGPIIAAHLPTDGTDVVSTE